MRSTVAPAGVLTEIIDIIVNEMMILILMTSLLSLAMMLQFHRHYLHTLTIERLFKFKTKLCIPVSPCPEHPPFKVNISISGVLQILVLVETK